MFLSDARRDQAERAALRQVVCLHCVVPGCDRDPQTCEAALGIVGRLACDADLCGGCDSPVCETDARWRPVALEVYRDEIDAAEAT